MADTVLVHPNRDKPESKSTKSAVILLLVADAALTLIVTIGGWSELQGAQLLAVAFGLLWAVLAYFVLQWNRGVLPVASAALLGLLTAILVPVQFLLILFAMRGFQQKWNVEVEVTREEAERGGHEMRPLHA